MDLSFGAAPVETDGGRSGGDRTSIVTCCSRLSSSSIALISRCMKKAGGDYKARTANNLFVKYLYEGVGLWLNVESLTESFIQYSMPDHLRDLVLHEREREDFSFFSGCTVVCGKNVAESLLE